jgi:type I restriction enzyme, S subunit
MNAERLLAHYEKIADAPGAIARLRRFVFDLAVRGKLVPQVPGDEPASELLKQIASKRLKMVESGEARPPKKVLDQKKTKRFFPIPRGWVWTSANDLWDFENGDRSKNYPSKDQLVESGIPFVNAGHLVNGRVDLSDMNYISQAKFQQLGGGKLRHGDQLYCLRGSLGKHALFLHDGDAAIASSLVILRPIVHDVVPFLSCYLDSDVALSMLKRFDNGTAQPNLSSANLRIYEVPLPPLAEQARIVAKVGKLMSLCDRLEAAQGRREAVRDRLVAASLARLNAPDPESLQADARFALDALPALTTRPDQIKQLRQTVLNLAVRGKLAPQDPKDKPASERVFHDLPDMDGRLNAEIPPSWRWVRVEDVAEARLGKMLDKAKNKGRPYPYLRNTNVHWFDIRLDDLKTIPLDDAEFEDFRLKNGDVLICEGGHGIGRTAVWRGASENLVFQKALHRVRPGPCLDPSFFAQCCFVYFDSGIMQTYFTGVGIPHFTGRALAELVFPLPPLAEQHRIVAKVDELMALCDRLEASLTAASTTRRRLLDALLAEALAPAQDRELEAAE